MKCMIVGNGEIKDGKWLSDKTKAYLPDFIIAADGGYNNLKKADIMPDILLGDFDSIDTVPENCPFEIYKFPKEKDFTDIELAIEFALEKGCNRICLAGATGSRLDHSIANIMLLRKLLEHSVDAEIIDEHHEIFLIERRKSLSNRKGSLLSLLPLDPIVSGVYLRGFKYPLENSTIKMGDTLGISNVAISDNCEISVENGILMGIIADNKL
ncbi:MAG TPA: thiamine diphosphokinase [Clostridia bacterium]|nr:thiamine diphosphokinase [Clostridia bacterium]